VLLVAVPRLDSVVYNDSFRNLEYTGVLQLVHAVVDPSEVLFRTDTCTP